MPKGWTRPQVWHPLGPLALKSESDESLTVEIGGQAQGREFMTRTLELPPRTRVKVDEPFFALSSVHVHKLPAARLGIHSPVMGESYIIDPFGWGNIWVYGIEIILTGYIPREEFRRRSSLIQPGSRVFQYAKTRTKNLAVPVAALKPLGRLFEQVKVWEEKNRSEPGNVAFG
jgi:hypothetical protein